MFDIEATVIGAGVIGLAISRALSMAGKDTLIVEQHSIIGSETSSRNSEVIHAGIYYPKSSLKATLCVRGRNDLYAFCESHKVPYRKIGKLIVANGGEQIGLLSSIMSRAIDNGVNDLSLLSRSELNALEPELNGDAAIFSPSTGILDSHAYMLALLGDAQNHGTQVAFNNEIKEIRALAGGGYRIIACGPQELEFTTKYVVVSTGLLTSKLLRKGGPIGIDNIPDTRFARGSYFRLTGTVPFSHLVYPVPEPGGLGVHFTIDIGSQAKFGPDVEWIDDISYDVNTERSKDFYSAIRKYWPGLPNNSLVPDYAGIRPKLSGPGQTATDFLIIDGAPINLPGFVALLGIESPGLTSSLAIAAHVAGLLST